jgi:hypothetical protein
VTYSCSPLSTVSDSEDGRAGIRKEKERLTAVSFHFSPTHTATSSLVVVGLEVLPIPGNERVPVRNNQNSISIPPHTAVGTDILVGGANRCHLFLSVWGNTAQAVWESIRRV